MAPGDDAGETAPSEAAAPKELGLADAMAYARELQKEGRLEAADELYRRIIAVAPDYPEAWHFRGCSVLDGMDPEGNQVQFKQRDA